MEVIEDNIDLEVGKMPTFETEEEKQEYLQNIFNGEELFPLVAGGMGIDYSNKKEYVSELTKGGVIPTMSASGIGLGDKEVYDNLFGETKNKIFMDEDEEACNHLEGTAKEIEKARLKKKTWKGRRIKYFREQNRKVLKKRIEDARSEDTPYGVLGMNLMAAVTDFNSMLETMGNAGIKNEKGEVIEQGVDILHVGAGIVPDLGKKMLDYPHMKYVPIVSSSKAARATMYLAKKCRGRLPDAFYVESPKAGGHNVEGEFDPEQIIKGIREYAKTYYQNENGDSKHVPIIYAGGIACREDIKKYLEMGYDGVAVGTKFLVTKESGLPDHILEERYLNSKEKVESKKDSPAGLPSNKIRNPKMDAEMEIGRTVDEVVTDCIHCILKGNCEHIKSKGEEAYCIADKLPRTKHGYDNGVLFAGKVLEELRKDHDLYRDENGKTYVPYVKETIKSLLEESESKGKES